MVLIISNKGDIHCNPVIKKFQSLGIPFFRLNTEELIHDYQITFTYSNTKPALRLINKKNGKELISNDISAVWDRRPLSQDINFIDDDKIRDIVDSEVNELNLWIRYYFHGTKMIGSSVLDRPNESKIRQLKIASSVIYEHSLNIKIPESIITNNFYDFSNFIDNKDFVVIKPIGSDAYQVDDIYEIPFVSLKKDTNDIKSNVEKSDIELCPVFSQEYIEKKFELRITSVGSKHFTCKINSQNLPKGKGREDWREGYEHGLKDHQEVFQTPTEIEDFCNIYLKLINSSFGCFDFICDKNGDYYFLECNPNGQWMWLEEDLGLPISDAIVDFLNS